jgi:hypothetical protein
MATSSVRNENAMDIHQCCLASTIHLLAHRTPRFQSPMPPTQL